MIQRNLRLFWFLLYFFVVGPENSRQPLNQSDVKLKKKRITNWSPSFSRASSASACFHLESLLANDDVNLCSWLVACFHLESLLASDDVNLCSWLVTSVFATLDRKGLYDLHKRLKLTWFLSFFFPANSWQMALRICQETKIVKEIFSAVTYP